MSRDYLVVNQWHEPVKEAQRVERGGPVTEYRRSFVRRLRELLGDTPPDRLDRLMAFIDADLDAIEAGAREQADQYAVNAINAHAEIEARLAQADLTILALREAIQQIARRLPVHSEPYMIAKVALTDTAPAAAEIEARLRAEGYASGREDGYRRGTVYGVEDWLQSPEAEKALAWVLAEIFAERPPHTNLTPRILAALREAQ